MFLSKGKNLSITSRLVLFYSAAIITLITVVASFLYESTIHTLHKANYEFLTNEINILQKLLTKDMNHKLILEHKIIEVPVANTGSAYNYYIRILDNTNKVVIETPQMDNVFRSAHFFAQNTFPQIKEINRWDTGEHYYLLMRAPVLHEGKQQIWQIQIALDITYQHILFHQWKYVFLLTILLSTLVALLLGYYITRNGLKSLYEFTDKTREISVSSLHQKMDSAAWPSEIKKLGDAFNEMLTRIEISFTQLNQFSADLAHELRTPINNIMGQTEIALSGVSSVEGYQNILGSNLEELQRISHIIDNLLFLARAENHQIDFAKTLLNVAEEIKIIFDFYQPLADEKNIKLDLSGNAFVFANSVMFRRMLGNLLSNSLKYTEEGGAINVRVTESNNQVSLIVSDSGIGIEPEHIPYIFNRFYRTDSARSQQSGGTGLGLAIVKSIVELHKGVIELTSLPWQGTSVVVSMPMS